MQTEQRKPTIAEFAELAGISENKASMLIEQTDKTLSMDAPLSEDTETSVGDLVASGSNTDDSLDKESLHHDMVAMLNQILSAKEREILMRSFGIDCKEEELMRLVAHLVCQENVSVRYVKRLSERFANQIRLDY